MFSRGATLICVLVALAAAAPSALAVRPISVSYASPSALQGLHVLARVAPLHVAELPGSDLARARRTPGIRVIGATVARRHLGSTRIAAPGSFPASEWEFVA